MRFALVGDHPDGLDLARAALVSGRHELILYLGPPAGLESLRRHGATPAVRSDLEELLADPKLDAVIVAGAPKDRPAQLRRALQAEAHVLCVHPADASPDLAVEAAMIQADTHRVLLPILPMTLHPAVVRFGEILKAGPTPRLIEMEIWSAAETISAGAKPALPGWDVLRFLAGEIGEVFAHAAGSEPALDAPLLISGKFVSGLIYQASYLPHQAEERWRIASITSAGRTSLLFPHGWPGPAQLNWTDDTGTPREESWPSLDPCAALVEHVEQAVQLTQLRKPTPGQPAGESVAKTPPALGWLDEIRAAELDDAARRSARLGRSSTLDLQEASEEATFKGTMTLVGCSLIWAAVAALILAAWIPWLAWFILPVLAIFLTMQGLRWIIPGKPAGKS